MAIVPVDNHSLVHHAPKSSHRDRFKQATGLDKMERENPEAVHALFSTLEALIAQKHHEISIRQNVKPGKESKFPYTFDSIKPEVIQKALADVYYAAVPDVQAWFDHWQGQCPEGTLQYWYIEWFLYKRFRHTDWRNKKKEPTPNQTLDALALNGALPCPPSPRATVRGTYYDPVRDRIKEDMTGEVARAKFSPSGSDIVEAD